MTQSEVAKRMGISQPAYAKKENSSTLTRTDKQKLADIFAISIEQLDF
jgi:transcriptional regulator with XRE-family HTH domain